MKVSRSLCVVFLTALAMCGCSSSGKKKEKLMIYTEYRGGEDTYLRKTIDDFLVDKADTIQYGFSYSHISNIAWDVREKRFESGLFFGYPYDLPKTELEEMGLSIVDLNTIINFNLLNKINKDLLSLFTSDGSINAIPLYWSTFVGTYNEDYFKGLYGSDFDIKIQSFSSINSLVEESGWMHGFQPLSVSECYEQIIFSYFLEREVDFPAICTDENIELVADLYKELKELCSKGKYDYPMHFMYFCVDGQAYDTKVALTDINHRQIKQSAVGDAFPLGYFPISFYGARKYVNCPGLFYLHSKNSTTNIDEVVKELINDVLLSKGYLVNISREEHKLPVRDDIIKDSSIMSDIFKEDLPIVQAAIKNGTQGLFYETELEQEATQLFMHYLIQSYSDNQTRAKDFIDAWAEKCAQKAKN